jgi:hypothetical protein
MSIDARLDAIPIAQIDEGRQKYVLIKVYGKEISEGKEAEILIVRWAK